MMKCRIISFALSIVLLLSVTFAFSSCSKIELTDEMYDRFVYLIEGSKELNNIYYGEGLPIYVKESLISEKRGIYYGYTKSSYDVVYENSKYYSIDDIKLESEYIYSTKYLNSIYETAFDGVIVDGSAYVRFYFENDKLYQNATKNDFDTVERRYDYSTMNIGKGSKDNRVNVDIEAYMVDNPDSRSIVTLTFKLENDNWYLDSPSY